MPSSTLLGKTLSHYRIVSRLGGGGMGEVYLAEDTQLGRRVAIKVLRAEGADATGRKRLIREAQSAAALDHPNICAIHEVGEDAGVTFIAMQYVEGQTLADRLRDGRVGLHEALDLAIPIADALAEAHRHAIVHRDVKPLNIMITPRQQVKVMDFGLAKPGMPDAPAGSEAHTLTVLTQPGAIAGTVGYMSPEQARGEQGLDARSDIFSFGILLFEMLTGRSPFASASAAETLSAILTRDPGPLARALDGVPAELERITAKALRKDREERYQDIKDLRLDLEALRRELEFEARLARSTPSQPRQGGDASGSDPGRPLTAPPAQAGRLALAAAVVLLAALGGVAYWHRSRLEWAAGSVPRLEALAREGRYSEAYALALQIRRYRPADADLKRLITVVSDDLSVSTEPSSAEVYLKRFDPSDAGTSPRRESLGRTPLNHVAIPRGDYILRLELAGREPFERTISSSIARARAEFRRDLSPAIEITQKLFESGKLPLGMVAVPAGTYKLVGYGQPTQATAVLGDFFIDKYEVSNGDYKDFVSAGGYRSRDYWKHPFLKDGRQLSWDEAMRGLVDRTGLPGPRHWTGGSAPRGTEAHPVTGITWYEAAAYAAFRGKALPTVYQWEKAARDGSVVIGGGWVMPWGLAQGKSTGRRANFESGGTLPVSQLEFGMGPFGCFNMAGNASEWVVNETAAGFVAAGGSWADPPYLFGDYGTFPGFYSSDRLGFRCALTAPGVSGDQGGAKISAAEQTPLYPRSSDASYQAWLGHYRYDKTPLDAKIEESLETSDWKRDKVTYLGAGGERTYAYLYLPKSVRPPFQVIHFVPGSAAYNGLPPNDVVERGYLAPYVKSGRAVFIVALRGYLGREWPAGRKRPEDASVGTRDETVRNSIDLRRGLDYLEARPDIDAGKLAFMNVSIAYQGIIFSAVEPRYRCVILMAAGLYRGDLDYIAEANPVNFAPHIKQPKLMLNGRWDEDFAFKTDAEPLFKLLSEPKRLELFDGGHLPPAEIAVPIVNRWLDETLGPVRRD